MESFKKFLKEVIPYIIIIVVVLGIKKFIFAPVLVNGTSMMDTLYDKDVMILDKIGMRINGLDRFDIVVIQHEDTKIIKRIIGLPGDTLEYKDNKLYINGKKVKDSYGTYETNDIEEIKIPKNSYYVLGDNRIDSVDSRIIGPVADKNILGKAHFTIYPFIRFGSK